MGEAVLERLKTPFRGGKLEEKPVACRPGAGVCVAPKSGRRGNKHVNATCARRELRAFCNGNAKTWPRRE